MSGTRTIIVGGGVIGVCIAYELARADPERRITLLERDEIGRSASFGNAGLISPGHPPLPQPGVMRTALKWMFNATSPLYIQPRLDPGLLRWLWTFMCSCRPRVFERNMKMIGLMSRETAQLFREIAEREQIEFELRTDGYLDAYLTQAGLDRARHEADLTKPFGLHDRVVSGDEAREIEPALQDEVVGALHHGDSAIANPYRFVSGLADETQSTYGVEIRIGVAVDRIVKRNDKVVGVRLDDGEELPADDIILAAGIWTDRIARTVDARAPMQAAKGYHVEVEAPTPPSPRQKTACLLGESFVVCTPINDRVRIAGTLEMSGINHELRERRIAMLTANAGRYLHGLDEPIVRSRWCGLRPCTADGLPIVGRAPGVRGLYLATGHAMMGFWMAPITARLIRELIVDNRTSFDIAPLDPARF